MALLELVGLHWRAQTGFDGYHINIDIRLGRQFNMFPMVSNYYFFVEGGKVCSQTRWRAMTGLSPLWIRHWYSTLCVVVRRNHIKEEIAYTAPSYSYSQSLIQ